MSEEHENHIEHMRVAPQHETRDTDALPHLIALDRGLRNHDETTSVLEFELVKLFMREHGYSIVEDFGRTVQSIAATHPNTIVRREDPVRLFEAIGKGTPLNILFDQEAHGGAPYPNSGELAPDARGLRIPYQRGFGRMPGEDAGKCIVTIVGFLPERGNVRVRALQKDSYTHYNKPDERALIRMVDGVVPQDAIIFVEILIPRPFCPDDMVPEVTREQNTPYITFLFRHEQETSQQLPLAA